MSRRERLLLLIGGMCWLGGCGSDGEGIATDTQTTLTATDTFVVDAGSDVEVSAGDVSLPVADVQGETEAEADADVVTPPTEVPIVASEAFLARRAEYLEACLAKTEGGTGGIYGQACRVHAGLSDLNDTVIDAAIAKLVAREDTADFRLTGLMRLLYLDNATGALGDERRASIEAAVLAFKFWLDEPGKDGMAYWTENHQILFHSSELLAGQRWPEVAFGNDGKTGREHYDHAKPRVLRWLNLRGRFGFSEWHSNVYFNEDIPAVANLADFAEDKEIQRKAAMVLDVIALDLLANSYRGFFATTAGRTYPSKYIGGLKDSTREAQYLLTGLGSIGSPDNFGATHLATGGHVAPPLLEGLAAGLVAGTEHRQRDSFAIDHGPTLAGVSFDANLDDVAVWAGLSAIAAPQTIDGSMQIMDDYDLWDGFLFGSLPAEMLELLVSLVGTPDLIDLALELEPLGRGMALEAVDTYVYRTPDYQLAAAQDWKPGLWSAQTKMWQATLDEQAFVLAVYPVDLGVGDIEDVNLDAAWNGGWMPRVTAHRQVAIVQYGPASGGGLMSQLATTKPLHAYFPRAAFDEVVEQAGWTIGRSGDGYVALWCSEPTSWGEESDYELVVDADGATFVVELGSAAEHGSFDAFVAAITGAAISVTDKVRYTSPALGEMAVGWTGTLTVAGDEVDVGPHERWQSPFAQQAYGKDRLVVSWEGEALELDFSGAGVRRVVQRTETP